LEKITDLLFRKEDAGILKHLEDDGMQVEPEYYLPVLPLLLINGCVGIGTGFSTDIPPYNPSDLMRILRERLLGRLSSMKHIPLKPWWQGFKGTVESVSEGCWSTKGVYTFDNSKKTITISELPVGVWTKDYKVYLDELCIASEKSGEEALLKSFDDLYTDEEVKFILYFETHAYEDMKAHPEDFEKRFRLTSSWRTTNMVAFDMNMKITKYTSPGEILEGYYEPRLNAYEQRRQTEMMRLKAEAVEADATARFLQGVLEGSLEFRRATDDEIVAAMVEHSLPALSGYATSVDGYEYLIRLRMDRVKASAVENAVASVVKAKAAMEELDKTTAAQLWLKDLESFESGWEKMQVVRKDLAAGGIRKTTTAKKK
jgi:DNA topoisomerase-2